MKKHPALLLLLLFISSTALAAEDWSFKLSPYIWFAGLEGDMGSISPNTVPVDVSASDAVKDTKVSFMIIVEAKKERHGIFADLLYTDVRSEDELIPAINLTLSSKTKTAILTLAYQYAILEKEKIKADLFVGVRGWSVYSALHLGRGLGLLAVKNIETWVDPVLGAKARVPFAGKFYASGSAGIGGFGIGADFFYEASLNIGYQWSKILGTTIGYRIFGVDYENGGYIYDVVQQGAQLGLTWSF
jgi:hypothetical protein